MAKAFRIEKKRAGRPVPMLVGKHAIEYENFLSVGMIMLRKTRVWLVSHDRSDLARFRWTHQMHALAPDRPARSRRPFHPGRIGHGTDGEVPVDWLTHALSSCPALSSVGRPPTGMVPKS